MNGSSSAQNALQACISEVGDMLEHGTPEHKQAAKRVFEKMAVWSPLKVRKLKKKLFDAVEWRGMHPSHRGPVESDESLCVELASLCAASSVFGFSFHV